MLRDAVSRTANVGTVGTNGLILLFLINIPRSSKSFEYFLYSLVTILNPWLQITIQVPISLEFLNGVPLRVAG